MATEPVVTPAQREQMIAEAAYFRAERRGFRGGDAVRDWCEAEAEVDAQLRRIAHEQLVMNIDQALEAAAKRLRSLKRKLVGLPAEAHAEWEKEINRLVTLHEGLGVKLAELRVLGERSGQRLLHQADKLRVDMADLVHRLSAKVDDTVKRKSRH